MKQILFSCAAVILVLTAACNKHDVRKSATLNLDFEVEANSDSSLVFERSATLNPLDNDAIAAIKEQIDRYEIRSINYSIWEFYGNDSCRFTGKLGIQKINDPSSVVYYSYNNFAFDPLEQKINVPLSDADVKRLEDYLISNDGLEFTLDGTLSHKPIHFIMNVELNVDAVAEK